MSIHSIVAANITDYETLIAVLNENGLSWSIVPEFYMKDTGLPPAHVVQATIGQGTVWIWQVNHGEPFHFQSKGWFFRNKRQVEMIATAGSEAMLRQRQRTEQERRLEEHSQRELAEQQRQEKERQREAAEQQRQVTEKRQREDEHRRREAAEGQRRLEEERQRQEEEKRQRLLADEAAQLLSRLDSTFGKPRVPVAPVEEPPATALSGFTTVQQSVESDERLNELIGKLHQEHALRKILEYQEDLEERGLSLESKETLEDQTIELRFRG